MRIRAIAPVFLAMSASPALADLTAEDVLAAQLNLLSGYGAAEAETTGTTTRADGLTVDGYVVRVEDDEGNLLTVRFGGTELVELGDGSVRIVYPDRFPMGISTNEANSELEEMSFELLLEDMSHVVSGDLDDVRNAVSFKSLRVGGIETTPPGLIPEALEYDYVVEDFAAVLRLADSEPVRNELDLEIGSFLIRMLLDEDAEGAFEEIDRLDAELRMDGFRVASDFVGAETPEHNLDLAVASFDWRQSMAGEGLDGMDMNVSAEDLAMAWEAALSPEAWDEDFAAAIRGGQGVDARLSYGRMAYDVNAIGPEGEVQAASSAGETRAELSFDRSGFTLTTESRDNVADIVMPPSREIPFTRLSYSLARTIFEIDIPFLPMDERQPFRVKLALMGIAFADDLWTLFDPAEQLPRDPMDIEIDIDGTTRVASDAFAEETSDLPFRETEARLNKLRVSIAGAELTGTGEAKDTSVDDTPSGLGRLDLRLTGGNTLLDTLIRMGLVTNEQAMPVRMGLSLIARPGEGPDTLVSTIEAKEDGSILANGQRIK